MERLLSLRRNVPEIAKPDLPSPEKVTMTTPPRFTDYKKKGNGIDKRTMRVHRRSIDQRKMRDVGLLKHRVGLDTMSPLKEVQNVTHQEPQPGGRKTKQSQQKSNHEVQELKDRLKKWKEEKELKKKLERQKKYAKPMFKVHHIEVEKVTFGRQKSSPTKNTRARINSSKASKKTQSTTMTTSQPITRVTRSSARVAKTKTNTTATSVKSQLPAREPKLTQKKQPQRSTRSGSRTQTTKSTVSQKQPAPQRSTRGSGRTQTDTKSTVSQKQPSQRSTRSTRQTQNTKSTIAQKQQPKTTRSTSRSRVTSRSTVCEVNTDGFNFNLALSSDASSGEENAVDSAPAEKPQDTVTESSEEEGAGDPTSFFQQAKVNTIGFNFNLPYASDATSSGEESIAEAAAVQEPEEDMVAQSSGEESTGKTTEGAVVQEPEDMLAESSGEESTGQTTEGAVVQDDHQETKDTMALFKFRLPTSSTSVESSFEFRMPISSKSEESSDETTGPTVHEPEVTVAEEAPKVDAPAKESDDMVVSGAEVIHEMPNESILTNTDLVEGIPQKLEEDIASTSTEAPVAAGNPSEDMVAELTVPQTVPEVTGDEEPMNEVPVVEDQDRASTSGNKDVVPAAPEKVAAAEVVQDEDKDVPYFRQLVRTEKERLTKMCKKWQDVVEVSPELNEDALGEIRTTIGKAQLLVDQRFKQFIGLVDNCEFNLGELKTHCTDLIGFWEMVSYQVEDINKMFVELDKLQANNWVKEVAVKPKKLVTKKLKKKPKQTEASKKAAAERVAARQRLMAARNALKAKATRSKDSEKIVFDAGFFKVESPVKSPSVHCKAGSPLSAAFLRRTSRTPGSQKKTQRRSQTFIPTNPRLSLCGTLSNLVLSESSASASGVTTRSRQGTPVPAFDVTAKSDTPLVEPKQSTPSRVKLGMPFGVRPSMQFTPLPSSSPYMTRMSPRGTPGSQYVPKPSTPLVAMTTSPPLAAMTTSPPLAAKPSTPPVAMVTPLKDGSSSAKRKTPRSRKRPSPRNESTHTLIPGIGSPKQRDNLLIPGVASPYITVRDKTCNASIFTPPPKMTPNSSANVVSDLICLDSPLIPTSVPATTAPPTMTSSGALGSLQCFAAINASADMRDLLGTDVVMSPVRRSGRLRHTSGAPAQVVVDTLASMPDEVEYGYQPNVSLL